MIKQIKLKEIGRFLFGGGSAVVVDYSTYCLFIAMGIETSLAKVISFILGSAVGFVINKLWTFERRCFSEGEIIRYILLYSMTAYVNVTVNSLLLSLGAIKVIAFLGATGGSTILNFLGQKFFVFQVKGD